MGRVSGFLRKHPLCCFCGGSKPAETIDHVPSAQMFLLKQRPSGLEVPACKRCNSVTRNHEQAAALLGRIYPRASTQAEFDERGAIMHAVRNNLPEVFNEMYGGPRRATQLQSSTDPAVVEPVFEVSIGPAMLRSLTIFAVKLAYALHYELLGSAIPSTGAAAVRVYTNKEKLDGEMPEEVLAEFKNPRTLRQGKKHVGDQFAYDFRVFEDGSSFYATIRFAFAVHAFTVNNIAMLEGSPYSVYPPSFFADIVQ